MSHSIFARALVRFLGPALLAAMFLPLAPTLAGAARVGTPQQEQPKIVPPGVVRTEEPVFTRKRQPARARDFHHRVPPPLEEVVVFSDSLNGLRLDSLAGWTHYDASERPTAWNISNFQACQGNGWWCGIVDSSWVFDPNRAGYDNSWVQYLNNFCPLDSLPNGSPVVRLSFRHRLDIEPDYDYAYIEVNDPVESWTTIQTFTGKIPNQGAGCDSFTVVIPDSIVQEWKAGNPENPGVPLPIPFRFTFVSDIAYSSSDGLYPGDGWIIDNVTIRANTKVLFFDNMEGGMKNWTRSVFPPVGDYFTLDDNVLTEDVCSENRTNIWVDWNPIFQSLVPRLDNLLNTPPIPINRSSQVSVAFDVYRNLPINACFYYHLNYRTKNAGDANWSNWTDPTRLLYYGSQKDWARQKVVLPTASNHDSVQVQLGLADYSQTYCDGVSTSAGVYAHFDNVQVLIVATAPPFFVTRDLDLFNDTFQTTPFFNDDNFNSPLGDSVVVQAKASRGYKNGFMFYRLNGGSFASVPLQGVGAALPTYYYADVPAGSYPANTKLEYYFSVTDSTNETAYSPFDAVAAQTFYSAAILPLKTAINLPLGCTDSLATILFVNHFSGREEEPLLEKALKATGFKFDVWNVLGPSSGVGNSIGGSDPETPQYHWPVTDVNSLIQYSTIVWHSGNLKSFTISKQDQAVLQSWIQQPGKDRNLWITGDNVAFELATQNGEFNNFLGFTCGARFLRDIWENTPQDSLHPLVKGVAGGPGGARSMHANADCPLIDDFDLVTLSSTATSNGKAGLVLTYPNTFGAATRYATDYNTFNAQDSARVVFMGFSFSDIEEGGERIQLVQNLLTDYFRVNPCYVASAVEDWTDGAPAIPNALAQNAPNPFNPETVIHYSVARPGPVVIRVYSVSGALVRTLVDRAHAPGTYVTRWNGTDDRGRTLPSGAYFYRLESNGFKDSKKLILLR